MKGAYLLPRIVAGVALVLNVSGGATFADGRDWEDDDHDYDRARRAVEQGEIMPMAELLERLQNDAPGEVVGIELEREDGAWVYEFKIVDGDGRRSEVYVDAGTGAVISTEDD